WVHEQRIRGSFQVRPACRGSRRAQGGEARRAFHERAAVFYAVSQRVQDFSQERLHPVFLLDEVHLLHQDTLDHLHILLNYEWDSKALLSLVLVGLRGVEARLRLGRSRSLYARLSRRLTSDPLTPEDTGEYLAVRLGRAGCERELFPRDSVTLLHEATGGALRDLDRL